MKVTVQVKYATTPTGIPGCNTVVTLDTTDTSYSALKEMIQARFHGWYNIQILSVK
ncbi:MAG: hypothetical protein IJT50_14600 [Lentisphaeria bacterium]|nr:hypothetical protein [Lentisphaeria bacterium]